MKKPSTAFWILAVLFLLWNLFGCAGYLMERMLPAETYVEMYGPEMAAMRDLYPIWTKAAYALAVWSGLLAAIMLLLRRGLAVPLFIFSLISAIVSFAWGVTNADYIAAAGGTVAALMMPIIVVAAGIFEVFYSRRARSKGYLR